MKKVETKEERQARKDMHMLQLSRYGKGMETEQDRKDWEDKFEKANPLLQDKNE